MNALVRELKKQDVFRQYSRTEQLYLGKIVTKAVPLLHIPFVEAILREYN